MQVYNNSVVKMDVPRYYYAVFWILFSNVTILFNKWLIDDAGFQYPIILTCWHMFIATLFTQFLARKTTLLNSRHGIMMTAPLFMKTIVPIGLLYSGSMIFNNLVYVHLSVPFIQMLKATGPVVTLMVGWLWGVEHPTWSKCGHILLIVFGVVMASAGEIQFSWLGILCQVTGILFESVRVIMIQSLMSSKGLDMDPFVLLYYYAPVCAVTNFTLSLTSEWRTFGWIHIAKVGPWILTLNAFVALLLNIFSILLIGKMSALIYVLLSVLKNILLVTCAVAIWNTPITPTQLVGYSLALTGLGLYQLGWELKCEGTCYTLGNVTQRITDHLRGRGRKPRLLVAAVIIAALLAFAFLGRGRRNWRDQPGTRATQEVGDQSNSWLAWTYFKDVILRTSND
ncbi:TPT-domain-containing protein [Annulohypoxylon maeteangense]|uniref:TPT-domain-containing protein n=1 Tax=Annulohypoxylon maeteangense TaxID=1927788 RepID=UPI002007A79C|nr:TPT-domain-containing protein [Annulohypoxylon maeteangense]KAI0881037.1 TPT-domain-containing protein [Annulohypoxylon maeteangense]